MFGKILGFVFGAMFVSMGIFVLNATLVPTFQTWQSMKNWQPVNGQIIDVKGYDNDTKANYLYSVAGKQYQNKQVYVARFKDNIGSYHQNMYRTLSAARQNGAPVTVWYNSENPQQAILDKNMRWGLFSFVAAFGSVFILIGLSVIYFSCFGKSTEKTNLPSLLQLRSEWKRKRAREETKENFFEYRFQRLHELKNQAVNKTIPAIGKPWLRRKAWQTEKIRSTAKSTLLIIWVVCLIWNAISAPLIYALPGEWVKGNYAIIIGLIFPVAGVFILYKAIQLTLEWFRFGVLELVMDPYPGAIGGHVGGHVDINKLRELHTEYKVELECVFSYVSGTGKNRSRSENIKWAEGGSAQASPTSRGTRLSFRFDVPEDLPEADVEQSGDYYFWRVRIRAQLTGADLARDYNIPVFKTAEVSRTVHHDVSAQAEKKRVQAAQISRAALNRGALNETALAKVLRFEKQGTSNYFYFPMFRNKALSLFALIFALGFGFATISMMTVFAKGGGMAIVMLFFSLPFGLVALTAGMATIYLLFNSLSVSIQNGKLTTVRRLLLLPIKSCEVSTRDIRQLILKRTGSTGQGIKKTEYFKIFAHTHNQQRITLAEGILGEDLANQLKEFLADQLHIIAS